MKKVFRIMLTAIMMVAFSTAVSAQGDQAQAKQIAHELALDDATKQKFIETFCAYQKMYGLSVPTRESIRRRLK